MSREDISIKSMNMYCKLHLELNIYGNLLLLISIFTTACSLQNSVVRVLLNSAAHFVYNTWVVIVRKLIKSLFTFHMS